MITVKGKADADWAIISHIIDPSAPNIEFKNITFDCKTIKDASGHIFVRQKAGEWKFERFESPLSDSFKDCYKCSNCGTHWEYDFGYCPHCGAKMGGEDSEQA